MTYYVWLEYYCAAPVNVNVKSDETAYGKKHVHGQQPTPKDIRRISGSLFLEVQRAYADYNERHPADLEDCPPDADVERDWAVKTRSTKD